MPFLIVSPGISSAERVNGIYAHEARLAELLEELEGVSWDIIGLSKVRRAHEGYTVLNNGHVLCYRGLPEKREYGVGFLIHKDIVGNVDEFYSINERVTCAVINLNKR